MEYLHEKSTLWVPMGTLDETSNDHDEQPTSKLEDILDRTKDCHIFQEDQASFEEALQQLDYKKYFGLYKNDVCCGKPWDELEEWNESKEPE